MIDKRAIISPKSKIAKDVIVGPGAIIGDNVEIGAGTIIGAYAIVESNTKIGKNNKISQYASIGSEPQHIDYAGESTYLEIGDNNVFREFCTICRGSPTGPGVTTIGDHNFFMAYTHVAHDCVIGNHVIFSNNASIAGHVVVGDYANLGAFSGIHQFCRIGAYSFLGRCAKVVQDVLPYMLVVKDSGVPSGVNVIGLRRYGFKTATITALKKAFHLISNYELSLEKILNQLKSQVNEVPEVQLLVEAFEKSERGIARYKEDKVAV